MAKKPTAKASDEGGAEIGEVIQFAEREFTIESFVRTKGDLGNAFLIEHRIQNEGRTAKRTMAQWELAYGEWLRKPRK